MSDRLNGKIAIVTGAAQGMGAAIARMFVAEGAKVVLTDVQDDAGQQLADELGPSARFLHHDVCDMAAWESVVATAESAFGNVNVLVNNAGIIIYGGVEALDEASFRKQHDVNTLGTFLGMKAVVPSMRRAGIGSIINQSSSAGMVGGAGAIGYTATKWAVRGMTKAAAVELGAHNIRVNSVHPHIVLTPMAAAGGATNIGVPPIGRFGQPDDAAYLMVFLASDESGYISGEEHVLDGGSLAKLR